MIYFIDTSALIARFLARAVGHLWVEGECAPARGATLGIAEVTEAELAAALNQLVRGGILRKKRCDDALALFWRQIDAGEYTILPANSALLRQAANLCETPPLRGFDAIQLACSLTLREDVRAANALNAAGGGPILSDPIFLTEDHRLGAAATAEGFVVDSPLAHP